MLQNKHYLGDYFYPQIIDNEIFNAAKMELSERSSRLGRNNRYKPDTKKREEFNRMIEACKAGEIDMIITKSISRFARNTLDCLRYIRMLKDKNIPVFFEKEAINKTLQQNIAKAVVNADTLSPDGIQTRLEELQKELIKKANNKQDYDAIADEIFRLRDQKEQSELDSHHREEAMNRIKELQDFIAGQETDITEFDEALVKKLIEKITVFADHFTVEFKSGVTIDIEA